MGEGGKGNKEGKTVVKMNILLKISFLCKMYRCRKKPPQFVEFAQNVSSGNRGGEAAKKGKKNGGWVNNTYLLGLSREK